MPIYESVCNTEGCERQGWPHEWYAHHAQDDNPECPSCFQKMGRLISRFGIVFTGTITAKYNDKNSENAHKEGHVAWRVRSSKSGKPEPCYIENFDQQRAFCKEEGLVNPKDLPSNVIGGDDGKTLETRGMKGQWV